VTDAGRRRLRFAVKALASLGVLWVVVAYVGGDKLKPALSALTPAAFLSTFGLYVAIHAATAMKWRLFVRAAGAELRAPDAFRAYAAGLFSNLFLPSMIGGDVVRAGLAMTATRRKEAVVLGSLVDRLSDVVGLAVLSVVGLLALPRAMASSGGSAEIGRSILGWFLGAGVVGVGALVVFVRARPPRAWPLKLRFFYYRAALGARRLRGRRSALFGGFAAAAALQFSLLWTNARLGDSMGFDAAFPVWLVCWPLAKIAAMLPMSLAGLGVREAAFAALGARFGVKPEVATAASLAWQGVIASGGLLCGCLWAATGRAAIAAPSKVAAPKTRVS
jgi:glycosyltransferase 2 family protein